MNKSNVHEVMQVKEKGVVDEVRSKNRGRKKTKRENPSNEKTTNICMHWIKHCKAYHLAQTLSVFRLLTSTTPG